MNVHLLLHLRIRLAGHHPARVVELIATVVGGHDVHQHDVLGSLVQARQAHLEGRKHPPARLGDNHLGSYGVETVPKLLLVEYDARIVDHAVVLDRVERADRVREAQRKHVFRFALSISLFLPSQR